MNEVTDTELLAAFADRECEDAFGVLVSRHIHLVHSVAHRHTANSDQAEEITQAVFIILARKARSLGSKTNLPGRLYHSDRHIFNNRGRNWTAAIIAGAISAHSVEAARPALTARVSAVALKGSAVAAQKRVDEQKALNAGQSQSRTR